MKYPTDAIINTVPAAHELRKVSGFDPLKFLRRITSERTGEKVLKLELPYKRLWFRLACPNGRMVVKPLRVTDQIAVFEAMVYAAKDDTEPLAQFTSTVSAKEAPDGKFVQAAQNTALNEALENAGFGIQLCDLVESAGPTSYGSEIPVAEVMAARNASQPRTVKPVTEQYESAAPQVTRAEPSVPAQERDQSATSEIVEHLNAVAEPPKQAVAPDTQSPHMAQRTSAPRPQAEARETVTEQQDPSLQSAAVPQGNNSNMVNELFEQRPNSASAYAQSVQEERPVAQPVPLTDAAETDPPTQTASAPSYTPDMSVEDICQRMTLEEALNYQVQSGVCKGWTLAQVAERRAPSLRFYVYAENGDNVLKAAATIVLNETSLRKAG